MLSISAQDLRRALATVALIVSTLLTADSAGDSSEVAVLRIMPAQYGQQLSHDYYRSLLRLALDKTVDDYGTVEIRAAEHFNQSSGLLSLLKSERELDVLWSATSRSREKNLGAIKIPLLKGLLGFRLPIIRAADSEQFSAIETRQQLATRVACQGMYWPDSDVLEGNGLPVRRLGSNEEMFKWLAEGGCDYIPMAVYEAQAELDSWSRQYPGLMLFRKLILYYPSPMYFFVSPRSPTLQRRLQRGLQRAIADGSFEKLMKSHPATADLFPAQRWQQGKTIVLDNQVIPSWQLLSQPELWLLPTILQPR